jgi:hypothetical protein
MLSRSVLFVKSHAQIVVPMKYYFSQRKHCFNADYFPHRLISAGGNKADTPLALLLCCRQVYMEVLKILYSSTKFVFAMPRDLNYFQVLASPPGLQHRRAVMLAYGRLDWPGNGPLHDTDRGS